MELRALYKKLDPILRPIRQRILSIVARGVLESIDESGGIQLAKVSLLKDEVREGVERIQNYGFYGNPPKDSELVAVFFGGNREHGFIIGCEPRGDRPKLAPGDVAFSRGAATHGVYLTSGGKIEIKNSTVDLIASYQTVLQALAAEPMIINKGIFAAEATKMGTMKK